ncbi:MAG: AMP-binding protein [Pirellulaceae bacterium]
MTHYDASTPVITLRLLQQLKQSGSRFKTADSTGAKLSSRELLVRTLALRRYLLREVLDPDEHRVGIFLPPTVPAVATNLAVALADRVSVNLNYTVNSAMLKQCCEKAGLKHVITSRKFIDKVGLDVGCPTVFLEDIKDRITLGDKLSAFFNARLRSATGLHRSLGLQHKTHDDPVTIIFTSGSTGVPKGVVLTSKNITSNIIGIDDTIHLTEKDVVGILLLSLVRLYHSAVGGHVASLFGGLPL